MSKFLITFGLIVATAGAAAAAQTPERCTHLKVLRYESERNPNNGNVTLFVFIRNDDEAPLVSATFFFEFLAEEKVKVGQLTVAIGRLGSGVTNKTALYTNVRDANLIQAHPLACSFE